MINWKKANEHTPTSAGKYYPNSPETPYVSCVVWVCHPSMTIGGIADVVRWDTKNQCWVDGDMRKWFYGAPYEITHFSDDINVPTN